jgi:hypothetical protein
MPKPPKKGIKQAVLTIFHADFLKNPLDLCMKEAGKACSFGSESSVGEFIQLMRAVEQRPLEKTGCPEQVFKSGEESEKRYE